MEKFFPEREKRRQFILFLEKKMQEHAESFSRVTAVPPNVKCNCGHTRKHHYKGGWCHGKGHPKQGQCGCTWFHPNDRYLENMRKKKEKL